MNQKKFVTLLLGLSLFLSSVIGSYAQSSEGVNQSFRLFLPLVSSSDEAGMQETAASDEAFVEPEFNADESLISAAATTVTLLPTRYATTSGADGGQPVGALAVLDSPNTQNDADWLKYLEMYTPGSAKYIGYRSYTLPAGIDPATITALQVKANYQGPVKATQSWTWTIYNWSTKKWVKLGDNTGAPSWQWQLFTFTAGGTLRNYINSSTREIQVRLQSNNTADNMDLDYEALIINTGSGPTPTPTPTPTTTPTDPPTRIVTYSPTTALFANPERGFYRYYESHSSSPTVWTVADIQNTNMVDWLTAAEEATISQAYCLFYLDTFLDGNISATYLTHIRTNLTNMRTAGRKCILRFAYSDDYNDNNRNGIPDILEPENANRKTEPDLPQLLVHIDQLKPILQQYADIITVLQAGFIGLWGEWYYTDHFVDTPIQPDNISAAQYERRKSVVLRLLDALPANRMIALRYPMLKKMMFGRETPITASEAFQNTPVARLGFHNDAFLNTYGDSGTFPTPADRTYLQTESVYLTMGGEVNKPEGSPSRTCATALSEMALFHWSYINTNYYTPTLQSWKSNGCIHKTSNIPGSILDRLGYRLVLKRGIYPTTARPGGNLTVRIELVNEGFAAPYNPRDLFLVLQNSSGAIFKAKLPDDPRYWLANGQTHVIARTVTLSTTLAAGTYTLALHLGDPNPGLSNRPEYAIRLANANLWRTTSGWNDLSHSVTVSASARADEIVEEGVSEGIEFVEAGVLLPSDDPIAMNEPEEASNPAEVDEQVNRSFLPLVTR